jgi:hypothetical protein
MTFINTEGNGVPRSRVRVVLDGDQRPDPRGHVVAIYRQLRAQASTRAFELLQEYVREGESESFQRAAIEILTAVRDGPIPARCRRVQPG